MITPQDVYIAYRRAKSNQSGKGYRIPKDWDVFFATKMSETNRSHLSTTAGYFNTTWSNVNLDTYMETGTELFKTFSYHMFRNPKVLKQYIEKDKQKKRRIKVSKDSVEMSMAYISHEMKHVTIQDGYTYLQTYCKLRVGDKKSILVDYTQNFVDPLVVVYCLYYKYLILTDIERQYVYNISNRYRDLLQQMFEVEHYIKEKDV